MTGVKTELQPANNTNLANSSMESQPNGNISLTNSYQLEIIDKFRELGMAQYIALPQLVVVGDQSSGKSSVLEAISEMPFPRDSGLCTRFATHIIFRRTLTESIAVSIIPAPSSSVERVDKLRRYKKEGLLNLTAKDFLEILEEVRELMGISGIHDHYDSSRATFSDDVLKIELCGPLRDHLSIIDVPGIFRDKTPGVTTEHDIELVKRMVHSYIKDERTIILAVLPAPTDIATQDILRMAEEVDPEGIRTLGVLTKPDLVDKGGEENVMDLIRGFRRKLTLGYCVVRNRSQMELSSNSATRHQTEANFFLTEPWCRLEKDRVGILALKERLEELLVDITRREFPKVVTQLDSVLTIRKSRLASLGKNRDSADQQRAFLQEIANQFQRLTDAALDGYYSRDEVFSTIKELRLATLSIHRNEQFSDSIWKFGHTVDFQAKGLQDKKTQDKDMRDKDTQDKGEESPIFNYSSNKHKRKKSVSSAPILHCPTKPSHEKDSTSEENPPVQHVSSAAEAVFYPELSEILHGTWAHKESQYKDIFDFIKSQYKLSRSAGLISIGPAVLPSLWKEQSKNWEGLTMAFIDDMIFYVHDFSTKLLKHVCPNDRVRANLWSLLLDRIIEKYRKAIAHAEFLVSIERNGTLLTTNHYFNDSVQKCQSERFENALKPHVMSDFGGEMVSMTAIRKSVPMGNLEYTVQEIHDILRSYYTVARKRFVDTVCMQASDHFLLIGMNSPLRIFSSAFVSELTTQQLDKIAGEDLSSRRSRKQLRQDIAALQEAKKLLRS